MLLIFNGFHSQKVSAFNRCCGVVVGMRQKLCNKFSRSVDYYREAWCALS